MQKILCRFCGESKVKEGFRTTLNSKSGFYNKAYKDEKGRRWNGRVCPDCVSQKRCAILKAGTLSNPITKRLCNLCKSPLTADRYFNHSECVSRIESNTHELYYESLVL